MADFHFLRPWWLLALPVGIVLILRLVKARSGGGGWRRVVDPSLQPFVLTASAVLAGRRWPVAAAVAAWSIATLALAGPTWERLPVPVFRSNEALVVALDLSRSMDAADLSPSRLARAKLKLLSLLERRGGGQIGLVVFSAHAFTVTPLTTDVRTIGALVGALSSDIMPSSGSYVEAGLDRAASLLRQSGVAGGEILLISDAQPSPQALERARALRGEGITVHVLGVGTADGAPIPEPDGGFLTDRSGRVVVPRLDAGSLRRVAEAGGGRFSMLTADDRDLDALLTESPGDAVAAGEDGGDFETDVWRDAGTWLAVLLLPLVALGFRRGWVAVWLACLLWPGAQAEAQQPIDRPLARPSAAATDAALDRRSSVGELWQSLWQRPDQRGADALAADEPARAAQLFEDRPWRAAAQYRAGRYTDSAASLAGIDTDDAHYNRGNALARAGQLESAIAAYDRALELNSGHDDARFNRDLLAELLEDQQQEIPEQQDGGDPQQQQGAADQSGDGGEPQDGDSDGDSDGGEDGERQAQDAQAGDEQAPGGQGESGDQQEAATADSGPEDDPAQRDGEPGEPEGAEQQAAADAQPSAEELERWASEQAAEQWLRRIPQDPGGLLRRKFLYQYQRLGVDQDGNYVWPANEAEPW
jgi:Ca-activated chloride channel homolog